MVIREQGEIIGLHTHCYFCDTDFITPIWNKKYNKTAEHAIIVYNEEAMTNKCIHCPECDLEISERDILDDLYEELLPSDFDKYSYTTITKLKDKQFEVVKNDKEKRGGMCKEYLIWHYKKRGWNEISGV